MTALSQAALEIFRGSGPYTKLRLAMLTVLSVKLDMRVSGDNAGIWSPRSFADTGDALFLSGSWQPLIAPTTAAHAASPRMS
jgi:hypothetical protein